MKPNVPSAPALPIFRAPREPENAPTRLVMPTSNRAPLPTELQAIVEDFKRLRQRLIENIIPQLNDAPSRWETKSSDPFIVLETTKANRLLSEGRELVDVAGQLAFAIIARQYGLTDARRALMRA